MELVLKCKNCGHEQKTDDSASTFCEECGVEIYLDDQKVENTSAASVEEITSPESSVRAKRFSLKSLFRKLVPYHSFEEIERYFAEGTIGNIPPISKINTSWPRPWLFFRLLIFIFIANILLAMNLNEGGLQNFIVLGSMAIYLALAVFFFEMNVRKNVSMCSVLMLFFMGGAVALCVNFILFWMAVKMNLGDVFKSLGNSYAGLVEEPAKLLTVIFFIRSLRYPYILNGLLFGAVVGAGFGAFETVQYAFKEESAFNSIFLMFFRGSCAVVSCHILWTGMSAAALWMVKGKRKFKYSMLLHWKFLLFFCIAVVSHMLWNAATSVYVLLALGVFNWCIIFTLIKCGLNQLRKEKEEYMENPAEEPVLKEILQKQAIYVQRVIDQSKWVLDPEKIFGIDHLNDFASNKGEKVE